MRTRAQLAKVVERNPLAKVAKNPKRYQVSFLWGAARRGETKLEEAAAEQERVVLIAARDLRLASGGDRAVAPLDAPCRARPGVDRPQLDDRDELLELAGS